VAASVQIAGSPLATTLLLTLLIRLLRVSVEGMGRMWQVCTTDTSDLVCLTFVGTIGMVDPISSPFGLVGIAPEATLGV
jgi:hypothetical protein